MNYYKGKERRARCTRKARFPNLRYMRVARFPAPGCTRHARFTTLREFVLPLCDVRGRFVLRLYAGSFYRSVMYAEGSFCGLVWWAYRGGRVPYEDSPYRPYELFYEVRIRYTLFSIPELWGSRAAKRFICLQIASRVCL